MRRYWLAGPLTLALGGWTLWLFAPNEADRDSFYGLAAVASVGTLVVAALGALFSRSRHRAR
jgi:hypothetical protein